MLKFGDLGTVTICDFGIWAFLPFGEIWKSGNFGFWHFGVLAFGAAGLPVDACQLTLPVGGGPPLTVAGAVFNGGGAPFNGGGLAS
jgi:hypothetical protein